MYTFKCTKCNYVFDELIKNTKKKFNPECSKCKSETIKIISVSNFILTGSGWTKKV